MKETGKTAGSVFVASTALWSLVGVRRRREHEEGASKLTLKEVLAVGLTGGVLFVMTMFGGADGAPPDHGLNRK